MLIKSKMTGRRKIGNTVGVGIAEIFPTCPFTLTGAALDQSKFDR
jgi:hypothetical protein